jgi:hypothetical protein
MVARRLSVEGEGRESYGPNHLRPNFRCITSARFRRFREFLISLSLLAQCLIGLGLRAKLVFGGSTHLGFSNTGSPLTSTIVSSYFWLGFRDGC